MRLSFPVWPSLKKSNPKRFPVFRVNTVFGDASGKNAATHSGADYDYIVGNFLHWLSLIPGDIFEFRATLLFLFPCQGSLKTCDVPSCNESFGVGIGDLMHVPGLEDRRTI